MGLPSVVSGDTQTNVGESNSLSVAKPTNLADGDLVIVHYSHATQTPSLPTGFTSFYTGTAGGSGWRVAAKYITDASSEPTTYDATTGGSAHWLAAAIRITGAHPTVTDYDSPTEAGGSSSTPDPPDVTQSCPWSADMLYIALATIEGKRGPWSPPTAYTEETDQATTGGGSPTTHVSQSLASRERTGTDEEVVGTFTAGGSDGWKAGTIVVWPPEIIKPPFDRKRRTLHNTLAGM